MPLDSAWSSLTSHLRQRAVLDQVRGALAWDQQTHMPPGGAATRGEQMSVLAGLSHRQFVDPRVGEWLDVVESSPETAVQQAAVRNLRRSYDRERKVPQDLVESLARLQGSAFEAWMKAKEAADFSLFAPALEEIVSLTRQRAAAIDSARPAYDVLLDEYDPGTTTAALLPLFTRLRNGLTELIEAVRDKPAPPAVSHAFDKTAQMALFECVSGQLGYDLGTGRLDLSEHPFTVSLGPGDVRITTHIDETDFLGGLSGTIHEAGHGMYEQGLPASLVGTGVGGAASMGLHESQSRFWENFIGSSLPFYQWLQPLMVESFGSAPAAEVLYAARNRIRPDLIRIHADEVTYNLHIIVRVELEILLMQGKLAVADLPEAWNSRYQQYLGITPENDAVGVLQDVHWSGAAIGYFPSYTLGNLYAASLGATLLEQYPSLWEDVAAGSFTGILSWLRENVHQHAHLLDAPDRIRTACGDRDSAEDMLSYLWNRHGALYGVHRP